MKLVIDISEEFYDGLFDESYDSIRNIPLEHIVLVRKIKNGKPLNDVLDEIKAEFKSKADGDDWYHTTDGLVWEEAMEIIDKYREGESE